MNKRHYEHTLPNIRGSLSNTYDYSLQIKVSFPALLISGYLNLQILSNRFTNLFKPENRTFNKFFFRLYHLYLLHT